MINLQKIESWDARIEENVEEVYKRKRIEEYAGEKVKKTRSEWVKSFTSDQFVLNRELLLNFKAQVCKAFLIALIVFYNV